MKLTDIFPIEFTFWTTLWYIFLFYLVVFIGFQIYIYLYDLDYTIDCKDHTFKCIQIKKKGSETPLDELS
jgi:hypothetical protein